MFPDEGPGHFGDLAIIVVHKESMMKLFVHFHALDYGFRSNPICLSNRAMRLEKRQTIIKFHLKGIIPLAIVDVF